MTDPSVTLGEIAHHLDAAWECVQTDGLREAIGYHRHRELEEHLEEALSLGRRAAKELEEVRR